MNDFSVPPALLALTDAYTILQLIGRGSFGEVYLGIQKSVNRRVAIKLVRQSDGTGRARFLREGKILGLLRHPAIVDVIDVGLVGEVPYMVMAYLEGMTLRARLRETGPVAPRPAFDLILPLLEAVDHIHCAQVIHRDLKPENIMITPDGRPKVIDFGISKFLEFDSSRSQAQTLLTQTGESMGTPIYMAPEQLQGWPLDGRADIYAIGLILHELLYGFNPMHAETLAEVASRHLNGVKCLPTSPVLTNPARQFILRCLERKPESRYPSASAAIEAVRLICAQPLTAQPERRHDQPTVALERPRRRRHWSRALGGLSIFACLLLFWAARTVPTVGAITAGIDAAERTLDGRLEGVGRGSPFTAQLSAARQAPRTAPVSADGRFHFDELPYMVTGELTLRDYSGSLVARRTVTAPTNSLHIFYSSVLPSHDAVLVQIACQCATDLRLILTQEANPRHPRTVVVGPPKGGVVRELVTDLVPDSWYRLVVLPASGWGGLRHLRFKTRNLTHRDLVTGFISRLARIEWGRRWSDRDDWTSQVVAGLDFGQDLAPGRLSRSAVKGHDPRLILIRDNPDPRLGPVLRRRIADGPPKNYEDVVEIAQILAKLQDGEGASLLLSHPERIPDGWNKEQWLEILIRLASAGDPRLPRLFYRLLMSDENVIPANRQPDLLAVMAWGISFDELVALNDRMVLTHKPRNQRNFIEAMFRIDAGRTRELLLREGTSSNPKFDREEIVQGLLHAPQSDDQDLIWKLLHPDGKRLDPVPLESLCGAGPEYGPLVERALALHPEYPILFYLAGILDVAGAADILARTAADARGPAATRHAAVLGLGLMGNARHSRVLEQVLADHDVLLCTRAAWALGRLRDRNAVPTLLERCKETGAMGLAALWALGEIQDRRAAARLRERITELESFSDVDHVAALGLAAWALSRLQDPGDRPLFERLLTRTTDEFVRRQAARALGRRKLRPGELEHFLFPFVPLDRTGTRVWPEQEIVVEYLGAAGVRSMGWRSALQPAICLGLDRIYGGRRSDALSLPGAGRQQEIMLLPHRLPGGVCADLTAFGGYGVVEALIQISR